MGPDILQEAGRDLACHIFCARAHCWCRASMQIAKLLRTSSLRDVARLLPSTCKKSRTLSSPDTDTIPSSASNMTCCKKSYHGEESAWLQILGLWLGLTPYTHARIHTRKEITSLLGQGRLQNLHQGPHAESVLCKQRTTKDH